MCATHMHNAEINSKCLMSMKCSSLYLYTHRSYVCTSTVMKVSRYTLRRFFISMDYSSRAINPYQKVSFDEKSQIVPVLGTGRIYI